MGARGPTPKPTALKLLEGTRPDRVNADEPTGPAGIPDRPDHLDARARSEWERITPILARMRVLTQADGAALAIYCSAYSDWIGAADSVRKMGMLIVAGSGGLKINPCVAVANQARAAAMKALAEFGCTPSSRSKIKLPPEEKADRFTEYMRKRDKQRG